MNLETQSKINQLKNSKSEQDRKECIPLLQRHLKENPTDAVAWYDLVCCYDFCGLETEAESCYWKTYELGWRQLPITEQTGFFVGFGSTLRNNLKFSESEKVLKDAIVHFPEYPALKAFLAFTQYSLGHYKECAETLFSVQTQMPAIAFDGYERAIKWYVENLHTHPIQSGK